MEQIETRERVWTTQAGITLTLALAMGLASLGTSIANIALPALVAAFDAPFAQVQGVVVAYLAALTVSAVVAGRLGDRHGLKPMLVAGLGLFLSAAILAAIAPNLGLLIAARGVQGVGAAFLMVLSLALMRQSAEPARLGQAMGLIGTVSALGTALGPSLGGVLIPLAGWRGIFWLQVPLAAVALGLAVALLPATRGTAGARAPHPGPGLDRRILPNLIINALVAAVMMTTLVVGPFYLASVSGCPRRWSASSWRWGRCCRSSAACPRGGWWIAGAAARCWRSGWGCWQRAPSCWRCCRTCSGSRATCSR